MLSQYLIGIDIGTTGLKVVVLDRERLVDQAHRVHTLHSPHPGWAEEDTDEWWATVQSALREITDRIPPTRIAGVGVTGMVPAMVLLDRDSRVLRPAILMNDARSAQEVGELRAAVDPDEFFRLTAGVPNQQHIDPRWRWLVKHEPEVIEGTSHLCGSYDFIVQRLTGAWSLEENWAVESGLYDIRERRWHEPYLAHAGIRPDILPSVRQPIEIVGAITENAAAQTGLCIGTPVVAGSADHVAAALASGLTQPGDTLLKFGGGGDILYCTDLDDPDPHFYFDLHTIPDRWLINGCMAASGSFVKWFAAELGNDASLADLDAQATIVPPCSGGIVALPYLLGEKTPIFDPLSRGIFAGIMLHHTRAHLYRSVLEAVCYGFRHHLELLAGSGRTIRQIVAADGGSRSPLWMQIAADVTGNEITVVTGDAASAVGAAFVAGIGVGMFDDWSAIERFVTHGASYIPDAANVATYHHGYGIYHELYERLQSLFPAFGQLTPHAD